MQSRLAKLAFNLELRRFLSRDEGFAVYGFTVRKEGYKILAQNLAQRVALTLLISIMPGLVELCKLPEFGIV